MTAAGGAAGCSRGAVAKQWPMAIATSESSIGSHSRSQLRAVGILCFLVESALFRAVLPMTYREKNTDVINCAFMFHAVKQ